MKPWAENETEFARLLLLSTLVPLLRMATIGCFSLERTSLILMPQLQHVHVILVQLCTLPRSSAAHTETLCTETIVSKALAAEVGFDHVQTVTLHALEAVSNRLRDKKLSVRKEAASQLASVFR